MMIHKSQLTQILIFTTGLTIIWEVTADIIDYPKLFPSLSYILGVSFPEMSTFHEYYKPNVPIQEKYFRSISILFEHTLYSTLRVISGLIWGITTGLLVGLGIHFFIGIKRESIIILKILRSIPLLGLIPLFLYWFGTSEFGIHLYVSFAVFTVIASNAYEAVYNVPSSLIIQGKLLGCKKIKIFSEIVFNSILPELVGGLKNVIGLTWAFSLAAEYLAASKGLGYLISESYERSNMGFLIILASIYSFLGLISFYLLKKHFRNTIKWT